jgi:hypothetical protein
LEAGIDLVALRQTVALLHGEAMLEGWAADRVSVGDRLAGLFLLSSWRVMFVDVTGGFSAMPIANIEYVEIVSPTEVMISTWYDRLHLAFDSRGAFAAVLNLLWQDPNWSAMEVDLSDVPGELRCAQDLVGG